MHSFHRSGLRVLIPLALVVMVAATPTFARGHVANAVIAEQSKITLPEMSADGPALWSSNPSTPQLGAVSILAWTGTDPNHSLNIMQSSDGRTFGGKVTFNESAQGHPAVVAITPPTTVVLAWIGTDPNHSLNLLCQGPGCGTVTGGYRKITLADNSFTSPALVRFGSGFLLGWVGTDANHSLNTWSFSLTTSGSGFILLTKTVLSQFSSRATPSIAVNPRTNQLFMSWDATTPAQQVDFATSSNGTTWNQYGLNATTSNAPSGYAVASAAMPAYWLAWRGTDAARSLVVDDTSSFPSWPAGNVTVLNEQALGGPVLGFVGTTGETMLAWTGIDPSHHLNVAMLTSAGVPTLDQRIDASIAGLSRTQLIGQTIMIAVCTSSFSADAGHLSEALMQWDVGSAIIYTSCNGGPTVPPTAAGLTQLDHDLQHYANHPGTLLIGIDEEGGTVDRLAPYYGSTPGARQLANTGYPINAYNQAQTDAGRMRSLGLNVDFAPVVDVDQGGGVGPSRMFGTTVSTVTNFAGAFQYGLQQHGVAGSLKHWPGLGAATGNPDFVLPTINQSQGQMQAIDFPPFANLLYQNPGMVMVTTVLVPAYDSHAPADLSATLVNGVLRGQLGYQGVVVTDALGAQAIITYMRGQGYSDPAQGIAEASVRAFLAGDDLLLCPVSFTYQQAVASAMTQAVQSGRISQSRLLAAVHRIIRLKVELGLMTL
jgi:beta-N-acetylhexosaminidase